MSVSGTPERPNPPQRMVEPFGISSIAASAEGYTLSIFRTGRVEEKRRASRRVYMWLAVKYPMCGNNYSRLGRRSCEPSSSECIEYGDHGGTAAQEDNASE